MRDTTDDVETAELMNSSAMNNLAAGGGLAAVILAGLTVGVFGAFRRLKGLIARRR